MLGEIDLNHPFLPILLLPSVRIFLSNNPRLAAMSKAVFNQIKHIHTYPSFSIILPTHRTSPESQQDPIRLKNLIKTANERLAQEFESSELTAIHDFFERVQKDIDHTHNLEGLAVYINQETCTYVKLPFTVEERVIIDQTFATRDLIRSFYLTEAYYVLSLSQQKVRLFHGVSGQVKELHTHGFPFENDLYTTDRLLNSFSDQEDREIREFFNRIDKAFFEVYKDQPAELVIAGVESNIAHYRQIADHAELIMAEATGNFDHATEHQVAEKVWPIVQTQIASRQQDLLSQLGIARGAEKLATGVDEIYRLAKEGRGALLVAEKTYFQPAKLEGDTLNLEVAADAPGVIDDLVDEIAEFVYLMKGQVLFVDEGQLGAYAPIAMTLRY